MPTYLGVDGTSLYYDELGRPESAGGPPLILLGGGPARHPRYLGDLAGLGDRHRLVVPHLRGVGRSPEPAAVELGSWWCQAEDVDRLRGQLGLEQVLLVAHSAGTPLAIGYATRFPSRVAAMVLITPPAGLLVDVPSDSPELMADRRGEPALEAAIEAWGVGLTIDDEHFDEWQRRAAPIGYAAWGETERAHAADAEYGLAARRAYFSVDPPEDLTDRLTGIEAPVLVVAGARDYVTGLAPVLALAELFPAGELATIEHCGHFPWVEQPTAFRRAVDGFLDTVAPPAAAG
ncbi:alpha/beta hydrolase [Plantactinospora sp. B5E13]|uniref:alpha/beta fold hydrolase n=1 Tax=unclassified Plantactinospora TaxID=2631981 RepID=UPI00325ED2F2